MNFKYPQKTILIGANILMLSLIFNIIETIFFGFNKEAMSKSEEVCDVICSLGFGGGMTLMFIGFIIKKGREI